MSEDEAKTSEEWDEQMRREYWPPKYGVHICGVTPDDQRPLTVASFPTTTADAARTLFARLRECEAEREDDERADLIVDLFVGDDVIEGDFWLWRQDLVRLRNLAGAPTP